ncbi:hypothetical protein LPTSP4_05230 [Leptospira ryugenii]|uniref:Uncharacterized protein n=1 Tax=Leptospira ryugenii TaxID=1917863 RepID=A0A2P2DWJ9_9LEPT|nr:hypothetical protein LPTSP4_05230 [Leptospira ryugenii]
MKPIFVSSICPNENEHFIRNNGQKKSEQPSVGQMGVLESNGQKECLGQYISDQVWKPSALNILKTIHHKAREPIREKY